jgi:hypothetical protein
VYFKSSDTKRVHQFSEVSSEAGGREEDDDLERWGAHLLPEDVGEYVGLVL